MYLYKVVTIKWEEYPPNNQTPEMAFENKLNSYGQQGWEVIKIENLGKLEQYRSDIISYKVFFKSFV